MTHPSLVRAALPLLLAACAPATDTAPTPLELARREAAALDEANRQVDDALATLSAEDVADPALAAAVGAQADASILAGLTLDAADIETLVELVMSEVARDAEDDLRDAVEQLHATNEAKRHLRELLQTMREHAAALRDDLRDAFDEVRERDTDPPTDPESIRRVAVVEPLLGETAEVAFVATGPVEVTADRPNDPLVLFGLTLDDLRSGASVDEAHGAVPLDVAGTTTEVTVLRVGLTPDPGDAARPVWCTLTIDHARPAEGAAVDWTDARARAHVGLSAAATDALVDARAELERLVRTGALADDEHAALWRLLAGATTRLDALDRAAERRELRVDELRQLDTLGELDEQRSIRLQLLLDRRQKFIETLSSLMKKVSTTAEALTANLK